MLISPTVAILYLVVLGLTAVSYRRVETLEKNVYGRNKNRALIHVLTSMGYGLLGGVFASVLLVLLGVTVSDGVGYLVPLSLLLFLFSPRLLCFSYSGSLLSLSFLLFGWPKVNVPALMALVACLHASESLLIRLSGSHCSTPLYLPARDGRVVGGHAIQRFWPIPIIILYLIKVPSLSQIGGLLELPDWWPLIKPPVIGGAGTPLFTMIPLVAALGYTDMATGSTPKAKTKETSRALMVYSLLLLGFSVAASRCEPFVFIAALFAPIGHEIVIRAGNSQEENKAPMYLGDGQVLALDVFPKSPAAKAGIRGGAVIHSVGGRSVVSNYEMETALMTDGDIDFRFTNPGDTKPREATVRREGEESIGLILSPGVGDRAMVRTSAEGPLLALLRRWFGREQD